MSGKKRKPAVRVLGLHESDVRSKLEYWLSKTPEERISAVEVLRRQWSGAEQRIQRVVRVVAMHPEEKDDKEDAQALVEEPAKE